MVHTVWNRGMEWRPKIRIIPPTITSDRFASPNAPGLPAAPSKPKLPHSGGHTAEIRSEIAPEMAENNNNSNDNGGADDEILAAIQSHITKAKSREACYVFGRVRARTGPRSPGPRP